MLRTFIILLLAALTLLAISLQKTYNHIPRKELKRRARGGDELAMLLYRAVAYGTSLTILLWVLIGLSAGGFFITLAKWLPSWLALIGALLLVWFGFAWLPKTRVSSIGKFVARTFTPLLAWVLNKTSPLLNRLGYFLRQQARITVHTGVYEKEDLLEILKRQKKQADNRLTTQELTIAANALTYGDQLVRDVMIPRRMVKMVATTDTLGPILMAELHDSGHSRFPVYQDKQDNIVGTLYLRDLVAAKAGGSVQSLMSKKVFYVNEQQPLEHVLQAFFKTRHHLFIVVNSFEEVVGIITIEDILSKILGQPIIDEFDQFDDLRSVAAYEAKKDQENHVSEDKVLK